MSGKSVREAMRDLDAFPYVDTEYNHPQVQSDVLALIDQEMKSFVPPKDGYLDYLPYPELKFANAPAFKGEYNLVNQSDENNNKCMQSTSLDRSRFSASAPEMSKKEDVTAWRAAVDNASVQLQYLVRKKKKIDQSFGGTGDNGGSNVEDWNTYIDAIDNSIIDRQNQVLQQLETKNELNAQRLAFQTDAVKKLNKLKRKRDDVLVRVLSMGKMLEGGGK
jgi:flagellar biosynthesis chaperone FliJ